METLYDVQNPSLRKKQVTKKCGYKLCTKTNKNNYYSISLANTTRRCILSLVKSKNNNDAGFVNSTASKNPQLTNYEVSASATETPSSPSSTPATTPTPVATQEDESRRSQGQPLERASATTEEQLTMNKPNNTTSHGVISVVGRRRSMDEAVTIEPGLFHVARPDHGPDFTGFDFFGVYNGRGSHTAANRLHRVVAEQSHSHAVGVVDHYNWESVLVSSFARMNDEFGSYDNNNNNDVISGLGDVAKPRPAMALVVLVGQEEIVVANCGHFRAILYGDGAAVVPLSSHHQHERERDEDTSGTRRLKQQMISEPEPEVTVHKRTISDKFLIIATNGLWSVVTKEMACEIVNKRRSGEVTSKKVKDGVINRNVADDCAAMLVELALARGSKDNITVIVVELQHLTADVTSSSS